MMRRHIAGLAVAVIIALGCAFPADVKAEDPASISTHARGPQPSGMHGPLGAPPTPAFYLLNQTAIFVTGIVLLVVTAALGGYTLVLVRRRRVR